MKKFFSLILAAGMLATPAIANAWDLKDLLGGGSVSDVVTTVVDELTTKSNLSVSDLAGVWTVQGSAVGFESDNLLSKAGGVAAEKTVKGKIDPYMKKLGLTGGVWTIQTDGSFTLATGKVNLTGNFVKNSDGNFSVKFTSTIGKINLGSMKVKIEKNTSGMNVLFDASKIKSLFTALAGVTKSSLGSSVSSLFNSYDGLYIGFQMTKTGTVSGEGTSSSSSSSSKTVPSADELKKLFGK